MNSFTIERFVRIATVVACLLGVLTVNRVHAQTSVTNIDFQGVDIPIGEDFLEMDQDNTPFTPANLTGVHGVNVRNETTGINNITRVQYDTGNFFGQGASNKILYALDGTGTGPNGGAHADGGTPAFSTPATITGGGGFQLDFDFYHPIPASGIIAGGSNGHRVALITTSSTSQGNVTNGVLQTVALRFSQVNGDDTKGRLYALLGTGGLDANGGYPTVNYDLEQKQSLKVVGNYHATDPFEYTVGDESYEVFPQHYQIWLNDELLWSEDGLAHNGVPHFGNIPFRYNETTTPTRDPVEATMRLSIAGSSNVATSSLYLDNIQVWDHAVPELLLGDYNRDGMVNLADYTVWRDQLGATVTAIGDGADGNLNGEIDLGDYQVWKDHFGQAANNIMGLAGTTIPEPVGILPMLGACALLAAQRQHKRQ